MTRAAIASLLPLAMLLTACGGGRKAAWESGSQKPTEAAAVGAPATPAATDALSAAEAAWAARAEQPKLEEAIAKFTEAGVASPTAETYARLSRAYYFLAESVYSFDKAQENTLLATYDKGVTAGEQAIALSSPEFVKRVKSGTSWEDAMGAVTPEAVPALYWYATNLGKWAKVKGFAERLKNKDRLKAIMTRCLAMDPDYFYAAPHRFFGTYYAVLPGFAGRDVTKSEQHFKESLNRAPNYFATKVLMAENLAPLKQDQALFKTLLGEVLAADVNVIPELVPEQAVEKRKAQDLMKKVDDLF